MAASDGFTNHETDDMSVMVQKIDRRDVVRGIGVAGLLGL
ncbi:MAG: hypothetical protein ACI9CA_001267, partial [Natronomonas sp.]